MDASLALAQTYLRLNGYFTVTEYPIIEAQKHRKYRTATDIEILAVRFPNARRALSGPTGDRARRIYTSARRRSLDLVVAMLRRLEILRERYFSTANISQRTAITYALSHSVR